MARTDFSQLPIILTASPRKKFRKFHLFISTPLLAYGVVALFWGRVLALPEGEALAGILGALVVASVCELLGHLFERSRGRTYKIDKYGVHFGSAKDTWFEPLSAYKNVVWLERVEELGKYSATSVHMNTLACCVVLNHGDNRDHSVVLFSKDIFAEREMDMATAHQISELLGLPLQEAGTKD